MNSELYKKVLAAFSEQADCEMFFAWLEMEPDFMELSAIEIEINFMMRCVSELCFLQGVKMNFKVGDLVKDDLTRTVATIVKIDISPDGIVGIWLDNDYLEGGRHPWEVTELE